MNPVWQFSLFTKQDAWIAAISVMISISLLSFAPSARADQYLDAKELTRLYKEFCPKTVGEIRNRLRQKKAKIIGTKEFAADSTILQCDFASDKAMKKLSNPEILGETEVIIRQMGVSKYIRESRASIPAVIEKYRIDGMIEKSGKKGVTVEDLQVLYGFARAHATTLAIITLLEPLAGPE